MILKIDCPDAIGLVYKITQVLYLQGLNVLRNDEFVDKDRQYFFMRTDIEGVCEVETLENELRSVLPENSNIEIINDEVKNIVVLASKEHQCLYEVLIRCAHKEINANVVAVISNHDKLRTVAESFDVPYHFITHKDKTRPEHETEIKDALKMYNLDYVILAKYMRIFTPSFVKDYNNKMINIHHSFLPAFKGARPYHQAFARGVKIIGATAHFVNDDLDEGPIILQDIEKINHAYTAKDMSNVGKDVEKVVLANALKLVIDNKVFISGNKTIVF